MSAESVQGVLQQFQWALQALAQPAEVQIELFPDFVQAADELALDFEHWKLTALAQARALFTTEQVATLESIDRILTENSGEKNAHLWTAHALACQPMWAEVRGLAEGALRGLGWSVEPPPHGRSSYVPSPPRDVLDR